jgi:L-asparagine transporter-like permease
MSLVPWNELSPDMSPFVHVFDKLGIPAAAGIINFVVITAAASSCNSGIFSTGRMLYTLAQFKQAPARLGRINARHVPAAGIVISAAFMLVGVVLNYLVPEEAFIYVTSIATIGAVWTWGIIVFPICAIAAPSAGSCRSRGLPHARRAVHQLVCAGLSGRGAGLPVAGCQHPRGAISRPCGLRC